MSDKESNGNLEVQPGQVLAQGEADALRLRHATWSQGHERLVL